jgi:transcriptional regulator with XRE-family HTH domain
MSEKMQEIMNRMKKRRETLNMSYQTLANKVGISKSTLQRYETGNIRNMPIDKLESIAAALQVSPVYLMGWENNDSSFPRLSNIENVIVLEYRKSDDITKSMVLRVLSIDEQVNVKERYENNS